MGNINLQNPVILALSIALIALFSTTLGALIAVGGIFINEYLVRERKEIEYRKAFIERQLHEFYGPTIALGRELYSKYKLWAQTAAENNERLENMDIQASYCPSLINTQSLKKNIVNKMRQICEMFTEHSRLAEGVNEEALQRFIDLTDRLELEVEEPLMFILDDLPDALDAVFDNLIDMECSLKCKQIGRQTPNAIVSQSEQ